MMKNIINTIVCAGRGRSYLLNNKLDNIYKEYKIINRNISVFS